MERIKGIGAVLVAAALSGCAPKATVQKWQGSQPAMPAHSAAVCFLPGPMPEGVEYTFLGRAVGNTYTYGSFDLVENAVADRARSVGADVVFDQRRKMKIAPIPWGAARPQMWGMAAALKDPASFDCVASGGRLFGSGRRLAVQPTTPALTPAAAVAAPTLQAPAAIQSQSASSYDECMRRVVRISDAQLRMQAMETCDIAN